MGSVMYSFFEILFYIGVRFQKMNSFFMKTGVANSLLTFSTYFSKPQSIISVQFLLWFKWKQITVLAETCLHVFVFCCIQYTGNKPTTNVEVRVNAQTVKHEEVRGIGFG